MAPPAESEREELLDELLDDYLHALDPALRHQLTTLTTADLQLVQAICHTLAEAWFERGRAYERAGSPEGDTHTP